MARRPRNPEISATLVMDVRVDHDDYAAIRQRLKEALEDAGKTPTPLCLLIIGETRTGKSAVVRELLAEHAAAGPEHGAIVYAIAPSDATVKGILEALLQGLGDPFWWRGSKTAMEGRLHTLLKQINCRMIILDEFQHFADKGQKHRLRLVTDFLKTLVDNKPYSLVAVGLPTGQAVINANAQLAGRFAPALTMPRFDWGDATSRKQFQGVLAVFQKKLSGFEMPQLTLKENAFRVYLASAGRVGLVAALLDRAVRNAVRNQTRAIRLPDLDKAFREAIWFASRFPLKTGPFTASTEQADDPVLLKGLLALAAGDLYEELSGAATVVTSTPGANDEKVTKSKHRAQMAEAL